MHKIIFVIFTSLLMALMMSCEEEEYVEPNDFSDVAFYTSQFRNEEFVIGVNDYISFADLSHNAIDHSWSISSGNYFLEGPISNSDTLLQKLIVNEGDTVSLEKTVHVLFSKTGLQTVRLYNTFKDSVAYRGTDTLSARKEGEVWVLDTTFVIDVYDTIAPLASVKQEGAEIAISEDTIYVEAGTELEFTDLTTQGRPDTRSWNVRDVENGLSIASSSDSVATLVFKKLGVYKATLNSSRTGQNIPAGFASLIISNPIKVIPSSKPFVLNGNIYEGEDQTIYVPYNGEFQPFAGVPSDFTVMVNGAAFNISSVSLNSDDATLIEIKLSDQIYRSDSITVSYVGGTIKSTDERLAEAFSDVPVMMHDVNLLPDGYGFEDGGAAWAAMWDNGADFEFTTDKAASGQYSLKIVKSEGQAAGKIESINSLFCLEAGKTYEIRYKIWMPESNTAASMGIWLLPNWKQFWDNLANKPRGEWVTVTKEYAPAAAEDGRRLMIQITADGEYYFDDFYLSEKDVRP